ncbi:MAG: serine/threonine protein kinase [Planctomycetaceae bacterium]|nr:serine/threonine protein kinase [Planctomycetaceae bacterium]
MSDNSVTRTGDDANRDAELESVIADYIRACDNGATPDRNRILEQHPELADDLRDFFAQRDHLNQLAQPLRGFGDSLSASIGPGKHIQYVGDYELLEEVARGGMGVVYKARQKTLGRIVAVKMMLTGRLANDEDVKRFQIEAQAAANLQHPNIVPIHEVGQHEGLHYFSMDFVEGRSLSAVLRENVLPAKQAASYVRQMAEAIHYAHQQGTLHRDLKPSNVLIDSRDQVRITDFGLAMRVEGDSGLTQTGQIVGTPSYMPPEQAQGKRSLIGPGSDVYSLGAILYECLTGRAPFRADSVMKTIEQVIHREAASPRLLNPGIARDLETICLKCLEKEPHRRYGTAQLLADDLGRFLRDEPIVARPTKLWERGVKWVRRHPTAAALVFVSAIAMLALVGVGVGRHYNARLEAVNGQLKVAKVNLETSNNQLKTSNGQLAEASAKLEVALKDAQAEKARARRYLYVSQMTLAERARQEGQIGRVVQLLRSVIPESADQEDLRGFEWHHLWRLYNGEQSRWRGHIGAVTAIAFSPDGKFLASASVDKSVKLWDAVTGKEVLSLAHHTARVTSIAFSPNSKRLASGSADKSAIIWDAATGQRLHSFTSHQGQVTGVAFSPSGQQVATASEDKTVRIWNTATGETTFEFKTHAYPVSAVAFSPDGNNVGSVSIGGNTADPAGEVLVWNSTTGQVVLKLGNADPKYLGAFSSVCFSADGKFIAAGAIRGEAGKPKKHRLEIWELSTGQMSAAMEGHSHAITQVAFSPFGKRVVSSSADETVKVWDVILRKEIGSFFEEASALSVAFSPDGLRIASGSDDHTIKIWTHSTVESQTLVHPIKTRVNNVAFSPNGAQIAAYVSSGMVCIWDVPSGAEFLAKRIPGNSIGRVAWHPDNKRIAVGPTVMDLASKETRFLAMKDSPTGRSSGGTGTAFSRDGKQLAAASSLNVVGIWDTTSEECIRVLRDIPKKSYCVAFSPDGKRLAIGGSTDRQPYPGLIQIWNVETGDMSLSIEGYRNTVVSVSFSPDGRRLAAAFCVTQSGWEALSSLGAGGASPAEVRVWDTATGQEIYNLRGHRNLVFSVDFSPDGNRLASAGGPWIEKKELGAGEVKIWDMNTGQEVATLPDHAHTVFGVAFSPNGRRLASSSNNGIVKIWDGTPLAETPSRDGPTKAN